MNIWNEIFKPVLVGAAGGAAAGVLNTAAGNGQPQTDNSIMGVLRRFMGNEAAGVADSTTKSWIKKYWVLLLIPAAGIGLVLWLNKKKRF